MANRVLICRVGRRKGVVFPKDVLDMAGVKNELEIRVEGKKIILEVPRELRKGWFEGGSQSLVKSIPEEREWENVAIDDDSEWEWK
jgi:antitoxin MazE